MSESRIHIPGSDGRQPWLRAVDFSAPSAVAPDQQGRLRRMAEELGHAVTPRATNDLGLRLELTPLYLEERAWREAHPVPASDAVTATITSSAGGFMQMVLDPTLASLVVERLLGTEPDPARPLRPITTTDRALLSPLIDLLSTCLGRLWSDATGAQLSVISTASHEMTAVACEPTDPALLMAIEAKLFNTYTVMYLLIPQPTVAAVGAGLSRPSARGGDDPENTRAVQNRLAGAPVDVHVRLGAVRLTAGEIADLHPGDRVALPTAADEAAALIVDGIPVHYGHIGRSGARRAVRIGTGAPVA
ncbi:MAG: FliM/FliN family flagellar motor switch protein [Solirubrobacteraceae bacterium]|nr:FliM/FliN family flagellar motor switch protein [Patulibacter sp.]